MILVNLKLKQLQSNLVSHTSHTFIVFKLQKISTVLRDDRFCYFQIFFWCKAARILRGGGGFLDFFALYKCVCVCKCSFVLFNPLWATYNKTKQNVSLHYLVFRRFYVHKCVYPLLRKLILLISTSFLCLCRAFIHQSAVIMHLPANIGKPHLNFSYQRFCCMKMDLLLYTVTIKS